MDELTSWLRERLDHRERVAQAAQPGPWTMRDNDGITPWTDIDAADGTITSSYDGEVIAVKDAEHIVLNDPAAVLADVAAKRAILDLHTHYPVGTGFGCGICSIDGHMNCETDEGWCPTVRLLASAYAGEPGWREEWRP